MAFENEGDALLVAASGSESVKTELDNELSAISKLRDRLGTAVRDSETAKGTAAVMERVLGEGGALSKELQFLIGHLRGADAAFTQQDAQGRALLAEAGSNSATPSRIDISSWT